MKRIKLFLDPILYYMEDSSEFANAYYIDLTKEKIVSPELDENFRQADLQIKKRFFRIEPITSSEGYEIMQDFASTLESEETKNALFEVLEQKKPFWNFRKALKDDKMMEKRFREFKDSVLKEILKKRLAEIGYELEEKRIKSG